jgi:hypothetical protein
MKVTRTVYTLEPTTEFDEIEIVQTESGFSYYLSVPQALGKSNYIVFKNCIIGAFSYLKEKENFNKNIVEKFETYDEVIESIMNLTKDKINQLFDEPIRIGQPLFAKYYKS